MIAIQRKTTPKEHAVTMMNNVISSMEGSELPVERYVRKLSNEPRQVNLCLRAFRHDKF